MSLIVVLQFLSFFEALVETLLAIAVSEVGHFFSLMPATITVYANPKAGHRKVNRFY
jgi:hypothetical protein